MFIEIPKYILHALNMLNEAGYKAYIVGGCVRDAILNKIPNDWDICTSALPEQSAEIFKDFKVGLDGAKYGTVRVIIDHKPIEITTFRIDGKYLNNRTPESICFTPSLNEDLIRRDFTINAMAYSESKGIIDLYGGEKDLEGKIIRCVGNAEDRFEEDALRIMRALRFASQLGFEIEEKTKNAIFKKSHLLKNISAERITDEFLKLISYDSCFEILTEFADVIKFFMPHFSSEFENVKPSKDIRINLAYILSFSQCDYENIFGMLKLPRALKKDVLTLLTNKDITISEEKAEIKQLLCSFGDEIIKIILEFKSLFGENLKNQSKAIEDIIDNNEPYLLKHLAISGNDIKELGIASGNSIGNILTHLLDLVICDSIPNEIDYLLQEAKKYIKQKNLK